MTKHRAISLQEKRRRPCAIRERAALHPNAESAMVLSVREDRVTWNSDMQVQSVIGRPLEELLAIRPRRQTLDGFDPAYSDFVDYILRCTHRIWEEKNVGLIRSHYSADCPLFTLSGKSVGAETIVRNTLQTLVGHPDRTPIAEDVIWSEDAPGVFFSSHRIMSTSAHLGLDAMLGAPTRGGQYVVPVIADCVCRENKIVQEWLVRDYSQFARNFGIEPRQLAERLARQDMEGEPWRHSWLREEINRVLTLGDHAPPADHPAAPIALALRSAFVDEQYGCAAGIASPSIEIVWPAGRRLIGRGAWVGCLIQLRTPLGEHFYALDHWAARLRPDGDIAVALRWWLIGRHLFDGVWGPPTGRELVVLAISHYRLRGGRLIEDFTVVDEVGVLRQAAGGLGACQT